MGNHALSPQEIAWFTLIKGKKDTPLHTRTNFEAIKSYFRKFDTNGDGTLKFKELKNAFKYLGVKAPFWEALHAINQADENGDFSISEHELDALVEFVLERGISIPSSFHA